MFLFPLRHLLGLVDYLTVYCLISRYLEIFPLSFFYWVINWLHCIQITYSVYFQFSKVFEVCFETHYVTYLIDCFNSTFKEYVFCYFRVNCSRNVRIFWLAVLSSRSISLLILCQVISERDDLVSLTVIVDLKHFSF